MVMALRCHFPLSSSLSLTQEYPKFPSKSNHFLGFLANSNPPASCCRRRRSPHPFRGERSLAVFRMSENVPIDFPLMGTLWNFSFLGHVVELARKDKFARIVCSAATVGEVFESSGSVKDRSVSVVLLAGGKGKRMGAGMPKQYLPLLGQPIALYSFFTFSHLAQVKEIIVVCDPSYRGLFQDASVNIKVDLKFAIPGKERQDSVYNGFQIDTFE